MPIMFQPLAIHAGRDAQSTIYDDLKDWITDIGCHCKPKTTNDKEAMVRDFLLAEHISSCQQINNIILQRYLNSLSAKYKPSTIRVHKAHLMTFIGYLVEIGRLEKRPQKLRVPKTINKPPKFFSPEQRTKLLEAGKIIGCYPELLCGLLTGMRRGEMSHLIWDDIDFNRNEILVRGDGNHTGDYRYLPLHEHLKAVFLDLKRMSQYVFPIPDTGNFRYDGYWDKLKDRLSVLCPFLGKNDSWHMLRHTFATMMINEYGVDAVKVSKLLGHHDVGMTIRFYANCDSRQYGSEVNRIQL